MGHEAERLHNLDTLVPSRKDAHAELDGMIREGLEDVAAEGAEHGCSRANGRAEEGGFGAKVGRSVKGGVEVPEKGSEMRKIAVAGR